MSKYKSHVDKNNQNKEEVFSSFLESDIQKLLSNMEDSNKQLRKVSARFICELLHDSVENQRRFCELLEINMICGGKYDFDIQDKFQIYINTTSYQQFQDGQQRRNIPIFNRSMLKELIKRRENKK